MPVGESDSPNTSTPMIEANAGLSAQVMPACISLMCCCATGWNANPNTLHTNTKVARHPQPIGVAGSCGVSNAQVVIKHTTAPAPICEIPSTKGSLFCAKRPDKTMNSE